MGRALRLVLAVVAGFLVGSLVNMALIMASGSVIAPPPGADLTSAAGLKASLHLFEPRHLIFPFLAHALGTFVGALVAAWCTPGRTPGPAYTVGGLFLLGGVANVVILPAPAWFGALDLIAAYLPIAWLAHRLVSRRPGGAALGR
jgi:hypothetical protein